jgi:16S rRNA (guanine527-N7)-methyltransferase
VELKDLLIKGLRELEIAPLSQTINNFQLYLHELKKWNRAYNLTALKTDEDIIIKHFFDSLLYLKVILNPPIFPLERGDKVGLEICDIGSGAGFPGIPIAIVQPEMKITLIEPSRKKAAFLRHLKRTLTLSNVETLQNRVEDIKNRLFDIAVTRALFSIKDLIKKAGHVLNKEGFFVLNKGPRFEDEIRSLPNNVFIESTTVTLPCTSLKRHLIKVSLSASQKI